MCLSRIEELLSREIGVEPSAVGPSTVARAVRERMARLGVAVEMEYEALLSRSAEEMQLLVEEVVVPETWFFRDREPFAYLARFVTDEWAPAHPVEPLRVLSLPCSSGEETYSIAIALREAGLRPARYRIDGFDISREAIAKAEAGEYGPASFRGVPGERRDRFFETDGQRYRVASELKRNVKFACGNLMDAAFLAAEQPYDVVFCRNLLIYQHSAARHQIAARLDRFLRTNGVLFVGHAETMPQLSNRFTSVTHGGAFAYRKTCVQDRSPRNGPEKPPIVVKKAAPKSRLRPSPKGIEADPVTEDALVRVRRLADQGCVVEASNLCEAYVQTHGGDPAGHFLLGVLCEAAGHTRQAEDCMNRTLYLDAEHQEAMLHLALLRAQRGDKAGAEVVRRRAKRMNPAARGVS